MSYILIESLEDLEYLNKELITKPYLGLDTEFRRTTKENMKLSLLQVNDGEEIFLIDAVLINDPKDTCEFLFSQDVVKIFHSCKEDLDAVFSWTGKEMVNIFDTQIAHSFLSGEYSISYQALVNENLEILLDKNETRSNWLRRPLSDSQLKYAASDVEYLINIYLDQLPRLTESKKIGWFQEEIELLIENLFKTQLPEEISRVISKSSERILLNELSKHVDIISSKEGVNTTLFYSKKSQKDLIRLAIKQGPKKALEGTAKWRRDLIIQPLEKIISCA